MIAEPRATAVAAAPGRARWARRERWGVGLIAAHSVGVGAMLLLAPAWAAAFAGWPHAEPLFFLRQAGVFHFVVAFGYLLEHRRSGTVTLLVCTKAAACLFLLAAAAGGEAAWAVPLSGVADGAMGLAAWGLHRRAARRGAP